MPSSLPVEMTTEFNALIDHLASRPGGMVKDEDLSSVEALMFHRYVLRECFELIKENGPVIDGKHNPASILLPPHTGAIAKLCSVLNLGPAARARLKTPAATSAKAKPTPWDAGDE